MRSAEPLQAGADGAMGNGGPVAVAAQMAKIEVRKISGDDLFRELRGGIVGEMPVPAQDALLGGPRPARVIMEHLHIVIGFEHEHMGRAHAFDDKPRGMAKIGEETDVARDGAEEETHGITGVVRDAESVHGNIPEFKTGARVEQTEIEPGLKLSFNGFFGEAVAVDRDLQFGREDGEALGVIGVFVRDENSIQVLRRSSNPKQSLADLPET